MLPPGALFSGGLPGVGDDPRGEGQALSAPGGTTRLASRPPIIPGESAEERKRRLSREATKRWKAKRRAKRQGQGISAEDNEDVTGAYDSEPAAKPFIDAAMENMTRLLDENEARKMRPEIVDAILESTERMDGFLTITNRDGRQAEIWGTITEEQAGILADATLSLARTYRPAAYVVRAVSKGYLAWKTAAILLPRMWATAWWYPANQGFVLRVPGMPDVAWVPSNP